MQNLFKGLSFRLAKIGILIALCIGSLMSAIQISIDYHSQITQIDEMVKREIKVATPPAVRALYTLDEQLATEVVNGIVQYDFIFKAALKDELGNVFVENTTPLKQSNTRWLTQLIADSTKEFEAKIQLNELGQQGSILFAVDTDAAMQNFYQHASLIIAIGVIRSLILVILLFVAFYFILTKPLTRFTTEINSIDPQNPGNKRLHYSNKNKFDEFHLLVTSTNQLLDSINAALQKRIAAEKVVRKSEEHIRQIIDALPVHISARNSEGKFVFANKAFANFCGTTPSGIRNKPITQYQRFFTTHTNDLVLRDNNVISNDVYSESWEDRWISESGSTHQMHTHVSPLQFYEQRVALVVSLDITQLKNTQDLIAHMAYHDALTDLPNRSYLVERLDEEVKRASKRNIYGALLFIDLDQFKNINDSLGHQVGDAVLKHVSENLKSVISDTDIVVRLGGDEFIVVLNQLDKNPTAATLKAESIAESIRNQIWLPYYCNDLELRISCSIGIAMFPDENSSVHELISYADTAMYKVKESGRNATKFFNKTMSVDAKHNLLMEGDLNKALENKEFYLHYQPRIDASTKKAVGAEVLLRWNHPKRGPVPPSEFIPHLETSGLIVDVGYWALQETISQVKSWHKNGLWNDDMRIGINISPRQFRSKSFIDDVVELLVKTDFPASLLEMEITEGIAIQNLEETISTMNSLIELGIKFALDDFGTGYSSISYLKRLPVSVLKIDKSFVQDLTEDHNDRILVESIVTMGRLLNLEVVAEGVETPEQAEQLSLFSCPYFQGYLFSRPINKQDFTYFLQSNNFDHKKDNSKVT